MMGRLNSDPSPLPRAATAATPSSLLADPGRSARAAQCRSFERTSRELRSVLGEPYFAEDGFILYNRDCLEAMGRLNSSRFRAALTVTSPPYNIGKSYESTLTVEDYVKWCVKWIAGVHSVTSRGGAFWLNLGYLPVPQQGRAVPIAYLLWDKTPFFFLQEVVWHYEAGVATRASFAPRNEKWLFYVESAASYVFNLDAVRDPNVKYPNQKKNGKLRCNPLGKNPSDVWRFPKVTTGQNRSSRERTPHPAQFPLGVVERVIRVSSNPGEIVLDPFSGSASSGIASVATGRVYVGFELRADYCEIAVERFRAFRRMRRAALALTLPPSPPSAP